MNSDLILPDISVKQATNVTRMCEARALGFGTKKMSGRGASKFWTNSLSKNTLMIDRAQSLELSKHRDFCRSDFESSVFSMDLERSDERYLLCGCSNGGFSIFDLETLGQSPECEIKAIAQVRRCSRLSHKSMVVSCQWYPQDTGMFATSSTDKTMRIWDSNRLKTVEIFRFETGVNQHHWSPVPSVRSPILAIALGMSNVQLIDIRCGSTTQQLRGHENNVSCVQWHPRDSNILCSGGFDGKIIFWDVRSGKSFLHSLVGKNISEKKPEKSQFYSKKAHGGVVNGLKFTPDGLFLFSLGTEGILKRWDSILLKEAPWGPKGSSGQCFPANYVPRKLICLDFAYFGDRTILYLPVDDDIEMFSLEKGSSLGSLRGHYSPVNSCVYRERYQELYSAGSDKNLLVWLPKTDQNQLFMEEKAGGKKNIDRLFQDNWSDDEW